MNREEKSHADWTDQQILEQMNREEKKYKSVSFQFTNKASLIKQLSYCTSRISLQD